MSTVMDAPRDLDAGIRPFVLALRAGGVETFESCEGGVGHAFAEPTVRFHGDRSAGLRALAAAIEVGLPVIELRRTWPIIDGEPTGPWWELTFHPPQAESGVTYRRAQCEQSGKPPVPDTRL